MNAATTQRPGGAAAPLEDDVEGRAALKTYLLEAHGRMRTEPAAALAEVGVPFGISVAATDEPELLALNVGELALWLDTTHPRFHRLYTVGAARDADRVHESLVYGTGLLDCVWLPPRTLEALAKAPETRMVLFSLRHDRRPLRRQPDENGVDSVTLRFWGPRAKETLEKLRTSLVLPAATSVYSVRVRAGNEERYCLSEVFHNGKLTSAGTSFAEHDRLLRTLLDEHASRAQALERPSRTPRRLAMPVAWTFQDLDFAVARMFGGAEPFRLWGLPEMTGPQTFRTRAVDCNTGRSAVFEVNAEGVTVEVFSHTPASVPIRYASNLQYHVRADMETEALSPAPLLQLSLPSGAPVGFAERAPLQDVARVVLVEACGLWIRGVQQVTAEALVEATHGDLATDAVRDLCRRVMAEAAAHEWRTWVKPVAGAEGRTCWRYLEALPAEATQRLRELVRLNRATQQLVARLSGAPMAKWLQLSLFEPEALVPPVAEDSLER